jgi:bacterioferritin
MNNQFPQFLPIMSGQTNNPESTGMTVCIDSSPYPEVTGAPDPMTVAMLKDSYAGAHGELTSITTYIYQNGRSVSNDAFANAVLQIAICEMMHLDMLGDAITALGGNASFDDGHYYWNASYTNYGSTMKEMLSADIAAERTAIANYKKQISLTHNHSVKELLARIIKDEELHLKFFSETLDALQ